MMSKNKRLRIKRLSIAELSKLADNEIKSLEDFRGAHSLISHIKAHSNLCQQMVKDEVKTLCAIEAKVHNACVVYAAKEAKRLDIVEELPQYPLHGVNPRGGVSL